MTPFEFDGKSDSEKAEMLAFGWAKNKLESFRYEESERLNAVKHAKDAARSSR